MTVEVASTVYNLAGDPSQRTNYLQSLVAGAILGGQDISAAIQQGYMQSPGTRFLAFNSWAQNSAVPTPSSNYDWPGNGAHSYNQVIGELSVNMLDSPVTLTNAQVLAQVPWLPGQTGAQTVLMGTPGGAAYAPANSDGYTIWQAGVAQSGPGAASLLDLLVYQWVQRNQPQIGQDYLGVAAYSYSWNAAARMVTVTTTSVPGYVVGGTQYTFALPESQYQESGNYLTVVYTINPGMPSPVDGSLPAHIDITNANGTHPNYSTEVFIYLFGSGNATLDQMNPNSAQGYGFIPFIPVRFNKEFLSSTLLPTTYSAAKLAFQKAFANPKFTYDDLIATLQNNSKLNDIDYAYVVFGVSLNVMDNSCRKYAYTFFKSLMQRQAANGSIQISGYNPANQQLGFNMEITWSNLVEDSGAGLYPTSISGFVPKVDAVWLEEVNSTACLVWQRSAGSWTRLWLTNVVHKNFVYGAGPTAVGVVTITALQAMADTSESGFIVPLEANIYRQTPTVDAAQMCTACALLVLNSYQDVTTPWYASGIFQVVLFIAAIVLSVYTLGAGGVGLLGANLAVGSALGFTGTAAIIAGAAINAIAAVILTNLISEASVAVFGQALGRVIGVIASFAAVSIGAGLTTGQGLAVNWPSLMDVSHLLQLTSVIGKAVSAYIQGELQDTESQINQVDTQYQDTSKQIQQLYAQNIGYGTAINQSIVAAVPQMNGDAPLVESGDAFLTRTLMTGSDIAQLTMSMISNFSDLTLSTDLPF